MKAAFLVFLLCGSALADFAAGQQAMKNGDHVAALKEFLPLAKDGDAGAQVEVGFLYGHGQGIPHDYKQAEMWYRLAAEQGRTEAQIRLGIIYEQGTDGFTQDYKEAAKWYRMAAEQGNAQAQWYIGTAYEKGDVLGFAQDYKEAAKWYRMAAEQGNVQAQYLLGYLYSKGLGVLQDYVEAHMWLNLGGVNGDATSIEARDFVAKRMTPGQIAEAQRRAREWKPKASQ
jgi:TPR repeat protein